MKPLVRFYFSVFFRKIYYTGLQNITREKSIIFAVNHPTAFLDPIILASNFKLTTHFMLRGDRFGIPIINWLLAQIKTIPIFRFRDGFNALKNNKKSFDIVYQRLEEGANILILAEGVTKHEKKMRPIQKGAARMAFGAYEKYADLDVIIIPVGINYTDSDAFRSTVMVDIGPAIHAKDFYKTHAENPRRAIKLVTEEVSKSMYKRIVHINEDEDAEFVNGLLDINRNNRPYQIRPAIDFKDRSLLEKEKQITETINNMEAASKSKLKDRVLDYMAQLSSAGVEDTGVAQPERYRFFNTLIILIGLLPFALGYITNILPLTLGRMLADAKVKKIEFHSSIRFAVGMLSYFFYFLIISLTALNIWGWMGFLLAFIIPLLGWLSLHYRDFYLLWKASKSATNLDQTLLSSLQKNRMDLLREVDMKS